MKLVSPLFAHPNSWIFTTVAADGLHENCNLAKNAKRCIFRNFHRFPHGDIWFYFRMISVLIAQSLSKYSPLKKLYLLLYNLDTNAVLSLWKHRSLLLQLNEWKKFRFFSSLQTFCRSFMSLFYESIVSTSLRIRPIRNELNIVLSVDVYFSIKWFSSSDANNYRSWK